MNEETTRSLVHDLAAAFPSPPVSPETAEIYVRYLKDLPDSRVAAEAIKVLIRTELALPPIALVRETYTRYVVGVEASDGDGHAVRGSQDGIVESLLGDLIESLRDLQREGAASGPSG